VVLRVELSSEVGVVAPGRRHCRARYDEARATFPTILFAWTVASEGVR
jgi:hypothetical protein